MFARSYATGAELFEKGFRSFDNGGTDIMGTLFYRAGIAGQHPVGIPNPGLGSAIATVTFLSAAPIH